MLKNKLSSEEFMDRLKNTPELLSKEDLMKLPKNERKLIIILNNIKFLDDQKSKGELHCEYCKKGPLKIYGIKDKFNKIDAATVDHRTPISKGGDIFNYDNLVVACTKCNGDKGDMDYETWMNKFNK